MWYFVTIVLIFAAILLLSLAMIHLGFRIPRNLEKMDPGRLGLAFQTVSIPIVSQKRLFSWLLPVKNQI